MIKDLITCDEARIPVVWFVTHEEVRAEAAISEYAKQVEGKLYIWSLTSNEGYPGWEESSFNRSERDIPFDQDESSSPEGALNCFIKHALDLEEKADNREDSAVNKQIAVFRDPHVFLQENMSFIRQLRDASFKLEDTFALIVCISPEDKLPNELRTDVEIIYPGLPDKSSVRKSIEVQLQDYGFEYDNIDALVEACIGMTINQISDAIAKSITHYKEIDLDYIQSIKTSAISSVPGLTYIGEVPSMNEVGGLDGLKRWLTERRVGFSPAAREANLPMPRGLLCIGTPGCGKSLIAKATSSYFGMPLVNLNPPDLKGGIVGETEGNLRRAREAIDSLGQSVVWIDEFEKGMPKAGERNLDAGTSDAISQGMLNWMQERKGGAFLVACANDISALPPELLRKGRWDAIFFVDLPTLEERKEIFRIHLKKRDWNLSDGDIEKIAAETNGYSGAEIEAACIDGRWRAFGEERNLTADDILECIKTDVPLSATMEEQINYLRNWAKDRARLASTINGNVTVSSSKTREPGKKKLNLKRLKND